MDNCQQGRTNESPGKSGPVEREEGTRPAKTGQAIPAVDLIRRANERDWPAILRLFLEVATTGETFAYDQDTSPEVVRKLWFDPPAHPFVVEHEGEIVGTYYVRPNQPGRGRHVANAGYIVASSHRGQGIASALCAHSLRVARELGFEAMQFNFVVSTNAPARSIWLKHGFRLVGRLPAAFEHAKLGKVDALVMYRELIEDVGHRGLDSEI